MRAASWAYGQSKRPTPIPGVCRFTAGRPVPCTKIPISSTSYYFLNQLYARAAQSSCRKPRPELRSNALPAQNRLLSSVQAYGLAKVQTHGSTYGEPKVLPLGRSLSERQKDLIKRDQKTPASMTVLIWQVELICPYRTNCLLTQVGFARSHN